MDFIFSQSLNSQNFSQLIGISVECNRLDLLERALRCSPDLSASLYRLLALLQDFAYAEEERSRLLQVARTLFEELGDRYGVFRCLLRLYDLQGRRRTDPLTASGGAAAAGGEGGPRGGAAGGLRRGGAGRPGAGDGAGAAAGR